MLTARALDRASPQCCCRSTRPRVPCLPAGQRDVRPWRHARRPRSGGRGLPDGAPSRVAASATRVTAEQQTETVSVELPSYEMKGAVQLTRLRAGAGYAIVIAAVEVGSAAAAAGVRPGQQLLQVSDPIRPNEMWRLNENSSLRHVRQAVRMRVPDTTTLLLTAAPIPEWLREVAAARAAAQQQREPEAQPEAAAASGAADGEPDLLSNIVAAVQSGESFDDAAVDASLAGPPTVAQQLEERYQMQQEGAGPEGATPQQDLTALEKRQKRRKEYFEQASQRNDGPFFAGVAALFVLPPAIILLYAFASGYIDQLDVYGQLR